MPDILAQNVHIPEFSYILHDPDVYDQGLVGPYTDPAHDKSWGPTKFAFTSYKFSAVPAVEHFDRKVTEGAGIMAVLAAAEQAAGEIEVVIEYVDVHGRRSIRRAHSVRLQPDRAIVHQDDGGIRALRLDRIEAVSV